MDWTQWTGELLVAGVGGLLGGTFGAYFKGYSEEKGRHLATYEDIQSLLAQERGRAYEQEKGKRLATQEDIEKVLQEVQAVTEKTETIKAQITGDLWTRQIVWQQKRDACFNVLRRSHDLQGSINSLRATQIVLGDQEREGLAIEQLLPLKGQLVARSSEYAEALRHFFNSLVEAEVFLSSGATPLLNECRLNERLTVDFFADLTKAEPKQDKAYQVLNFLSGWITRMVNLARQELGVEIPNER